MISNKSKRVVIAGLMLLCGILLPFVTAHGFGITGSILLPMHIPVLHCGFFSGPLFGFLCGLVLPVMNSILTGMPALYPMALLMTFELATYGFVSGLLYKTFDYSEKLLRIYIVLIISLLTGKIVYAAAFHIILMQDAGTKVASALSAFLSGIPGIVIQLVLIPSLVARVKKAISKPYDATKDAIRLVTSGKATCVTVKNNKVTSTGTPQGISYIIDLYEKGELKDVFIADKIVGKAAAMIFTLGGIKACYGENVSESAIEWMKNHNIDLEYKNSAPYIKNRAGDGMCPMEETVLNINDETEALTQLKNKVNELKANKKA